MSAKETIEKVFHIHHDERRAISEEDNRAILAASEANLSIKSYVLIMH